MSIDENRFEFRQKGDGSNETLPDVRGHTLIVPCVSIGNVGQLAVDILLSSIISNEEKEKAKYVCDLDSSFCVPFVGSNPSKEEENQIIRTPLQIFTFSKSKLTILQQRSPIIKSQKENFIHYLQKWSKEKKFKEIIFLAGIDAGLRTDSQMENTFWHFNPRKEELGEVGKFLSNQLPLYTSEAVHAQGMRKESHQSVPPLPAGGMIRKILKQATTDSDWPSITALLVFAAEGDNRADAMAMAQIISNAVNQNKSNSTQTKLSYPSDWNLLFGPPAEPGMF